MKATLYSKPTYSYNNRHLVTAINYTAATRVAQTPKVSFTYDGAGNRTAMTDGLGTVAYNYNRLSQLTSETRPFTSLSQSLTLSYQYNLAGELTKVSNPWGVEADYPYDREGRLSAVTGAKILKSLGYLPAQKGNSTKLCIAADNRLTRQSRVKAPR